MTREEKKRLRMQIIRLLDECDTCEYKTKKGASVTVCRGCPIGKRLTELSGHLEKDARLWDEEEERFLVENYDKMSYTQIAAELGRTPTSVQSKIKKMRRAGLISKKKQVKFIITDL